MAHNLPRGGIDPETFAGVLRARVPAREHHVDPSLLEAVRSEHHAGDSTGRNGNVTIDVNALLRLVERATAPQSSASNAPIIVVPERRQEAIVRPPRRSRLGYGAAVVLLAAVGGIWYVGHRAQGADRPLVERGTAHLLDYDAAHNAFVERSSPEVRFVLKGADDTLGNKGMVTYDISLRDPETMQELPMSTFTDMLVSNGVLEPSQTQCEVAKMIKTYMFRSGDKQLAPDVQVQLVDQVDGTDVNTVLATMTVGQEGC